MKAKIVQKKRPKESTRLFAVLPDGREVVVAGSELEENRTQLQKFVGKDARVVVLKDPDGDKALVVDAWRAKEGK